MALPLSGVRVLDVTRLLPGPLCTLFLADLGAEILKVEAPQGGDYTRWFPPLRQQMSGAFAALNRNKRSLALDLKQPEGKGAFLRLVSTVDVVVEGFRPGVMDRLGLGYETLRQHHPGLVYCAITGYGQDGPMADRAGHDINYLARTGILGLTGDGEGRPQTLGIQVGDVAGGSYLAVASVLAALYRKATTGEGAFCDVSLCEGMLPFLTMEMGGIEAGAPIPQRGDDGMLRGKLPCYGVYPCKDGKFLSVGSLEPKFWAAFVTALGLPHLLSESMETGDAGQRVRAEIEATLAQRPRDEWLAIFREVDACVEPILELDELKQDPHAQARGYFAQHDHPTEGSFSLPRTPFRFSDCDSPQHTGAPLLGQQSEEILREAGLTDDEITALREKGITL